MACVLGRNVVSKALQATCLFYSRLVLTKIGDGAKREFREIEREAKTITKLNADLDFLNICLNNQLLPKFLNFKLYDVTAQYEPSTVKFKEQLMTREIAKKNEDLSRNNIKFGIKLVRFRQSVSGLRFYSAVFLLRRILKVYRNDILVKHNRKLKQLYGSEVIWPEKQTNIINLSSYNLNDGERSLLNKGLNFAIKKKTNPLNRKIEMERLYSCLQRHERQEHVRIEEK